MLCTQTISQCIGEEEVGQSNHKPLLQQLLLCVEAVILASGPATSFPKSLSYNLFSVILRVSAGYSSLSSDDEVESVMVKLSEVQRMADVSQLYSAHVRDVIDAIKVTKPVITIA